MSILYPLSMLIEHHRREYGGSVRVEEEEGVL